MRATCRGLEIIGLMLWCAALLKGSISSLRAEEFLLPENSHDSIIGEIAFTSARRSDTLLDIARAFDLGHDQIIKANPGLNRWIPPPGQDVLLPRRYILPPGPRRGIVLNLAELRLYFFPPGGVSVFTYPVSIGDLDWKTPLGTTSITGKEIDPSWYPPESIREEHRQEGEELPKIIPGDSPENPLGDFALKLGIRGYLIHGTDERRSFGIGMRVSHGCIRMYPEDIEELFRLVRVHTPVRIIDEPIKVGWRDDDLFLEVHRPLDEDEVIEPLPFQSLLELLRSTISESDDLDEKDTLRVFALGNGIPIRVATHSNFDE